MYLLTPSRPVSGEPLFLNGKIESTATEFKLFYAGLAFIGKNACSSISNVKEMACATETTADFIQMFSFSESLQYDFHLIFSDSKKGP